MFEFVPSLFMPVVPDMPEDEPVPVVLLPVFEPLLFIGLPLVFKSVPEVPDVPEVPVAPMLLPLPVLLVVPVVPVLPVPLFIVPLVVLLLPEVELNSRWAPVLAGLSPREDCELPAPEVPLAPVPPVPPVP